MQRARRYKDSFPLVEKPFSVFSRPVCPTAAGPKGAVGCGLDCRVQSLANAKKILKCHPALVEGLPDDDTVQIWTAFFCLHEIKDILALAYPAAGDHVGADCAKH